MIPQTASINPFQIPHKKALMMLMASSIRSEKSIVSSSLKIVSIIFSYHDTYLKVIVKMF